MKLKLQTKMYIAFSVVILFAVSCFSIFIHTRIFEQLAAETAQNNLQLCIKISENVDAYTEKMDDITKKIISNAQLKSVLKRIELSEEAPNTYETLTFNRELSQIISNAITLTSFPMLNVYIYSRNNQYQFVYNQAKSSFLAISMQPEYVSRLQRKQVVIYSSPREENGGDSDMISFVRSIFDIRANMYGYVEVQSDYSELNAICNINNIGSVQIIDRDSAALYPASWSDNWAAPLIGRIHRDSRNGTIETDDGYIYYYSASPVSGLITLIRYETQSVYESLQLLQNVTFWFCVLITPISIGMVLRFTKMLVKPLHELRDSVMNVTYDNIGLTVPHTANNEIIVLKDAFQHILQNLKRSTDQVVSASKAEAKARMQSLQAQITPHFLHNMLYTISVCAQEQRTDDVISMCKHLSDMLRYTINTSSDVVDLREEIACIKNYLSLQSKQYEDFMQYTIDWRDEEYGLLIPRLSLLPFVENITHHAFNGRKPPYIIRISAKAQDGRWSVVISDNGKGFTQESIDRIHSVISMGAIILNYE